MRLHTVYLELDLELLPHTLPQWQEGDDVAYTGPRWRRCAMKINHQN